MTTLPPVPAAPVAMPRALSVLAVMMPCATLAAMIGLLVVLAIGAQIGASQTALLVAISICLGTLLALTCGVVQFFVGSSYGSRQKDVWARAATPSAAPAPEALLPIPLPMPAQPSPTPSSSPASGGGKASGASQEGASVLSGSDDAFGRAHAIIAKWEGGYSDHPADPGGPTNYGITQAVLAAWRGRAVSAADVQALTRDESEQIFRARYWTPLRCAEMPPALALMSYNAGVNSGIGRGARFLQQALNRQGAKLAEDGEVGPLTLAACARADQRRAVDDYAVIYEAFYRSLSTFLTFGRGWLNRLADVSARARDWAAQASLRSLRQDEAASAPAPASAPDAPPPWLAVATALLGLQEEPGAADNATILAMAQRLGGAIARDYVHDDIPWCALLVNYCLHAAGLAGTDALLALDFSDEKFSDRFVRLSGPVLGAIATKHRAGGGGHVFFVAGRIEGKLVGRGGNQSNMVCDETFAPQDIVAYVWPRAHPLPPAVGASMTDVSVLPVVTLAPQTRREVELPA